jgi:hypothetical protein
MPKAHNFVWRCSNHRASELIQGRVIVKFLIAVVKERVFEKYGIRLEEEIQLV